MGKAGREWVKQGRRGRECVKQGRRAVLLNTPISVLIVVVVPVSPVTSLSGPRPCLADPSEGLRSLVSGMVGPCARAWWVRVHRHACAV